MILHAVSDTKAFFVVNNNMNTLTKLGGVASCHSHSDQFLHYVWIQLYIQSW